VVRCCEASPERHRKPSSAAAKALGEVQSQSPGRHGGGGCGRRGVLEMSGLKERSGFLRLLQKTTVCRRNFASLPRQARERPGQICLRELLSRGAAAIQPGSSSWHLEIRRLRLALACALIPGPFPVQSRLARQWSFDDSSEARDAQYRSTAIRACNRTGNGNQC
jgi:hypothetical protein